MKHRPFENWLLDSQLLDSKQKHELDIHLRTCKACSAIAEAILALRSSKQVKPAPGFSSRWSDRLVLARRTQRRRTILGITLFCLGGLVFFGILAGPTVSSLIGSPGEWLSGMVKSLLFIYTNLTAILGASSVIFRILPGFIPPFGWLVILSTLSGLGLLWSVSIWRLTRFPQGVKS
ncbi:MAG: hypothetical protein QGM50_08815 [Anaerolineae bacterium]|nr:hypothetical protein [Anaerolineae bacterium]